jgi:hypothetical protein
MEVEGKLHEKFQTEARTETFKVREFVVEIPDGQYPQYVKFQLTQDRCAALDPYNIGEMVKISFNLRGRAWTKDGKTSYFNSLDAWRLERLGGGAAPQYNASPAVESSFPSQEPPQSSVNDDLPF